MSQKDNKTGKPPSANTMSNYFTKRSPPIGSITGKRKRFLFNSKGGESETPLAKLAKSSVSRTETTETPQKSSLFNMKAFASSPKQETSKKTTKTKQSTSPQSPTNLPSSNQTKISTKASDAITTASKLNQFAHKAKETKTNSPFQITPEKPKKKLITKVATIKNKPKYTPMEQQVIQLWKEHPGIVLAIEVGYRFMFIGEDAIKASKVLHFILTPAKGSSHFPHCSVPAVTIHVHLHRLVNAGLKVGIVTQTETRALKQASNNRNNPFTRKLSQIYTKGTFISPKIDRVTDEGDARRKSGAADSGFLLCFCESQEEQTANQRETMIALVAVNVCTGEIIWDCFKDGFLRSELENRLASIRPTELIIPESKFLSRQTESLIDQYYNQNYLKQSSEPLSTSEDDSYTFQYNAIRIERVSCKESQLIDVVRNFYTSEDIFDQFPSLVIQCIGLMIKYLIPFSLHKLFQLRNNFVSFSQENIIPLDRNVIEQLEILENVEGTGRANLFWLIDVTITPFGSRLLRSWLLHPMKNEFLINQRLEAVAEIIEHGTDQLKNLLSGLPDLERGICRLFYHKCEPMEFISIMRSFMSIFKNLVGLYNENFRSGLLTKTISAIPDLSELVSSWLNCLSFEAAHSGKLYDLFQVAHLAKDPYPLISSTKANIASIEDKLNDTLAQLRSDTGLSRLKYITVATDEYLLEVTHKQAESVPNDWLLINKTKAAKRFRTPRIKQQYSILVGFVCQNREILDNAIKEAWESFVGSCKEKYYELRSIVANVGILDCLYALSVKGSQSTYVRPIVIAPEAGDSGGTKIQICNGRHPIVESIPSAECFVPNDTSLDNEKRCIMLTGPNMGGKSCYMKQVALIVLLAQIGSFVPASSVEFTPVDRIMVRMGAQDSLEQGKSTFFIEMQETSEILRRATPRSLVIIDELGRGTSTHDGVAIADATLRYLLNEVKCFTLFVTHYHLLCQTASQFPLQASSFHMGFYHNETDEEDKEFAITFLYKLTLGMASSSYGMNVAKLAGIPEEIIRNAIVQSQKLGNQMKLVDSSSAKDNCSTICSLLDDYGNHKRSAQKTYELLLHIQNVILSSCSNNELPLGNK